MCGYAKIGRQAWLRAKWGSPMRVRVSLAAPKLIQFKFINYVPQYVLYILLLGGGED